jgi:hypothetical protein
LLSGVAPAEAFPEDRWDAIMAINLIATLPIHAGWSAQ